MIPPISMAASRDQALSALNDFLPTVPFYGQKRNRVIPGHEDVSRLSGALRHRLIQESEIVDAVLHHHSFQAGEMLPSGSPLANLLERMAGMAPLGLGRLQAFAESMA